MITKKQWREFLKHLKYYVDRYWYVVKLKNERVLSVVDDKIYVSSGEILTRKVYQHPESLSQGKELIDLYNSVEISQIVEFKPKKAGSLRRIEYLAGAKNE